jgi:hypothetical protein
MGISTSGLCALNEYFQKLYRFKTGISEKALSSLFYRIIGFSHIKDLKTLQNIE